MAVDQARDPDLDVRRLLPWIEDSLRTGSNKLASGYQGSTLLYDDGGSKLVIKTPHGRGITRTLHRRMLRHEYEVYRKLEHHPNVPRCHGLVAGSYLVLEYIDAPSIREQPQGEDSPFHARFIAAIELMHACGVAHIDLKRKGNLLITADHTPVMIDFGTAIIDLPGFHPLNHYLFRLGKRFDYNSWIKHKYQNRMDDITAADAAYYDRSAIEKLASLIKTAYRKFKRRFTG